MQIARQEAATACRAVLVIDDHEQVRQSLSEAVTALGFAVDAVSDGDEALPLLKTRRYAAVLCDLVMPHMMGDQLFVACQQCHQENARRFIFLSGAPKGCPSCLAASHSGQPYLRKPCEVADVVSAIAAVADCRP